MAGLSHRYVRLFDLRDTSKYSQSIGTKSVYGLSIDPFNEHRFCCYVENTLEVYDLRLRNTTKPIFSVNAPNSSPIVKVQWDPVRHNVLTCLTKDSTIIQQYHLIQSTSAAAENAEYTHMDRHVGVCHLLTDFFWAADGAILDNWFVYSFASHAVILRYVRRIMSNYGTSPSRFYAKRVYGCIVANESLLFKNQIRAVHIFMT